MKFITTLVLAFVPLLGFSQYHYDWKDNTPLDEFGDPLDIVQKDIYCTGVFSNSATTNSDLLVRVVQEDQIIAFELYEYSKTPMARLVLTDGQGKIKVKRADKTVEEYDAYAMKTGGVFFYPQVGSDFVNLVKNGEGEEITVLIKQDDFSDYGMASYRFKLKTQTAE